MSPTSNQPVAFACFRRIVRIAMTVALLHTGTVHAAQFCVADHNQLRSALTSAAANNEDDDVRIRNNDIYTPFQSTIAFLATVDDIYDLSITGGWNTNCTTQALNSSTRIVASSNQTIKLLRVDIGANAAGTFRLAHLNLTGGRSIERGGCLEVRSPVNSLARVEIEHVQFFGCRALHGGAAEINIGGSPLLFRNNIVRYTQTDNGSGAVLINSGIGDVFVHNNTFLDNGGGGYFHDLRLDGSQLYFVYNNIFDSAVTGPDEANLRIAANTMLVRNLYRAISGAPAAGSTGNLVGVNPQFVPGSVVPRLGPNSPARNSGTNSLLGGLSTRDLDGMPRVAEGTVDRGAYEFQGLFGNSFE